MIRVIGFGVRNLRSLRDTDLVEIKPLTILVGKNSAGKSTFARILPLLKQSAERRKQAPLLWFGRLVDFGSFSDALSSFAEEKEIEIKFRFSISDPTFVDARYSLVDDIPQGEVTVDVGMAIGTTVEDDRTVLRSISLKAFGIESRISFENNRLVIRAGGTVASSPGEATLLLLGGSILQTPHLIFREPVTPSPVSDSEYFRSRRERLGTVEIRAAISHFVHGNTLAERKDEIADRLPLANPGTLLEYCKRLPGAPDTWRSSVGNVSDPEQYHFKRLREALLLYKLGPLLARLDEALDALCGGVSYLEPLRATAQRYYRREEVSIDELDPKGLNTTFFLQGLPLRERESLNQWLSRELGFTLNVRTAGGHSSLHIETANPPISRNMADVGFGYSQIVPVAIQLWAARRRPGRFGRVPNPRAAARSAGTEQRAVVVVEQPELHLHPAYQAKLADVFSACVRPGEPNTSATRRLDLIIETHSASIINRLGELIGESRLSSSDVQVIVFDMEPSGGSATTLRTANFDEKGVLRNWPVGFFEH
jgi:hypothetical protein